MSGEGKEGKERKHAAMMAGGRRLAFQAARHSQDGCWVTDVYRCRWVTQQTRPKGLEVQWVRVQSRRCSVENAAPSVVLQE
jgi:hypothetical protein